MRLRTALNEYKRRRGSRFATEQPTTTGAFSGCDDRLVYVDRDGSGRDYSEPLSGLCGLERSRLGIRKAESVGWFDGFETVGQGYRGATALVETVHDAGGYRVRQSDLTIGRTHLTHVRIEGDVSDGATVVACLTLAPESRDDRVGRLVHEDAGPAGGSVVETFHRREHDYVAASTGLRDVDGGLTESFDDLLDDAPVQYPRNVEGSSLESGHLGANVVVTAPLERDGDVARATLVTRLADHAETCREQALDDVVDLARTHDSVAAIRSSAREQGLAVPSDAPERESLLDDWRALALLATPDGGRIAGPDFDPFYTTSGGYGYTWFRDDAEISTYLLDASDSLGLEVGERLAASARFYCETQTADGSWPHRVWPSDGSLAPGWANARVEGDDGPGYQADQTASVTTFLARLLSVRPDLLDASTVETVVATIGDAVGALDDHLADDGLPGPCQNAWENAHGRFTHTAATYLRAYATVADAPLTDDVRSHARDRAIEIQAAMDALWISDRDVYALGVVDGARDERLDSATFALVPAMEAFDAVVGCDDATVDRLATHVECALDELYRESETGVAGLVRFEGDEWRRGDQSEPKVWSLSTALGADAAARLASLLRARGRSDRADAFVADATRLYRLLGADGPFASDAGFLAEQVYDDGTLDSATPLGWAHAARLSVTARLAASAAAPG